jgi:hypothetical protein
MYAVKSVPHLVVLTQLLANLFLGLHLHLGNCLPLVFPRQRLSVQDPALGERLRKGSLGR